MKKKKSNQSSSKEKVVLDISLIEYNLSLTPEERLLNHQRAFETLQELLKARKQVYGESQSSSKTSA